MLVQDHNSKELCTVCFLESVDHLFFLTKLNPEFYLLPDLYVTQDRRVTVPTRYIHQSFTKETKKRLNRKLKYGDENKWIYLQIVRYLPDVVEIQVLQNFYPRRTIHRTVGRVSVGTLTAFLPFPKTQSCQRWKTRIHLRILRNTTTVQYHYFLALLRLQTHYVGVFFIGKLLLFHGLTLRTSSFLYANT